MGAEETIIVIVMIALGGIACVGLTCGVRYLREHSRPPVSRTKRRPGLTQEEEEEIYTAAGPGTETERP